MFHPAIVVAPVTVMFEKLLLFVLLVEPVFGSLPLSVNNVIVPPAPVLLNAVTIQLLFTFFVPPEGSVLLFDINVTLPVVFTLILVNVLLLIL